jgi:hypothetical protein
MNPNIYGTAAAILRTASQGDVKVGTLATNHLSKPQRPYLEPALAFLAEQGDVEIRKTTGPGRPGRIVHAVRPTAPEPHCSTCTCHDVL